MEITAQSPWKAVWQFLKTKHGITVFSYPESPFSGMYSKQLKARTWTDTYTPIFTLITNVKRWK
jgi:hypothetical protein